MYQCRQILAYGTVSIFIVFVFLYGVAGTVLRIYPWSNMRDSSGAIHSTMPIPDLSQYELLKVLTPDVFPQDDPTRRIIVLGDIHGMMKPFEKLLKRIKYIPSKDILIHVGDIIAKGTHEGSLAVLHYMAAHNVTGVRGNHDQKVIEWRGWLDWISSIPEGQAWLKRVKRRWERAQAEQDGFDLKSWIQTEQSACSHKDKKWWKSIPQGWILFSDHCKIAKDMSEKEFQYLLRLPLRLYIPSAHAFIVHAGLLPADPRYSFEDSKKQPLARVPSLPQRSTIEIGTDSDLISSNKKYNKTIEKLRNLQELSLLTQIPQNTDPWVVLNMRSVVGDKVSRRSNEGVPWTKLWNQHMKSCSGYKETWAEGRDLDGNGNFNSDRLHLSCYPSTTIYGHAAGRGLVVKRWSFGLDSGCVYHRKLSALVIGKMTAKANWDQGHSAATNDEGFDSENDQVIEKEDVDDFMKKEHRSIPFGDRGVASIVDVRCE